MLTLENTSDAVKYTETYFNREITNPDNHVSVLKADVSDSKEILALKAELAELKAAQATVTTTQGGGNRKFNGKRRRDGGARTADKADVDTCKTCGHRHPGRPCWIEGEKKREQALALLKETDSILSTRKSYNKPSDLEIKALEVAVVANKESNQCVLPHVTITPTSTCTYVYQDSKNAFLMVSTRGRLLVLGVDPFAEVRFTGFTDGDCLWDLSLRQLTGDGQD